MPEGYTRSRARLHTDYSGEQGYSPRPRGGGNGLMFLLAGIIVVGLLVGLGFIFKDTVADWLGIGEPAPTVEPTVEPTPVPTPVPTTEPTAEPTPTVEATTTTEPTPTPPATEEAAISIVGNIFIDSSQLADAKDGSAYSFMPSFANIKGSLSKADLTIGTLETTLTGSGKPYAGSPKYNTPDDILTALKDAGFDLISTAHTHIFDYGFDGMKSTRQKILDQGMTATGTYISKEDYHTPCIVNAKSTKVGVVALSEKERYASLVSSADMNFGIKHISLNNIKQGVEEARTGGAEFVIVMLHWDKYTLTAPTEAMKTMAADALKNGADAVICSGPKFVQKVENVSVTRTDGSAFTGLVAYSLGNFISSETGAKEDSGLILNLTLVKDTATNQVTLKEASCVPTYVYSKSKKEYSVLPAGKYKDDQALLEPLSSNGKERVAKAWDETIAAVDNSAIKAVPE